MVPWGLVIAFMVVGTLVQFILLRRRRRRDRRRVSGDGGGLYRQHGDDAVPDRFVQNAAESQFSRDPPAEGHRYCPHCGTENREEFTYCRSCVNQLAA